MNVVGIIAEYNPFHQGHRFHLEQARRLTGASLTVVAMSGNYVQRGVPAMFDKYTRAKAALSNGADLVLELPLQTATGSAEYFASGAVRLLAGTGVVTDLCFGSECADTAALRHLADLLAGEPDRYRSLLRESLRAGSPWPKARAEALHRFDPSIPSELLESPNDLLAVEYLKALRRSKSPIRAHAVQRKGASYHRLQVEPEVFASAGGIRQALLEGQGIFSAPVCAQLPSCGVYSSYDGRIPMTEDAFSLLLLERLIRHPQEEFSQYFDVTEELANRIRNHLDEFTSFSCFTDLLKTRNLTRTAVSRALLHILLNIRAWEPPQILRVLGFRRDAEPLLARIAACGHLPLVTSPSDPSIPEDWLYADRLYERVRSLLQKQPYRNEFRRMLLVL